jgi:hypothetical protein
MLAKNLELIIEEVGTGPNYVASADDNSIVVIRIEVSWKEFIEFNANFLQDFFYA